MSHRTAFSLLVVSLLTLMATASVPSPIYPLYRERWGFSVSMLTVIFAVYVIGLLMALLTVGSLSDHLGRRPVLVAASVLAGLSTLVFATADGVGALLLARLLQGVATGTATAALAAALIEFEPISRPGLGSTLTGAATGLGMAIGAALGGVLVSVTARPDRYAFPALTIAFLVLSVALSLIPDLAPPRPGALKSLRPDIRVPADARRAFARIIPTAIAGWAATGLFLALVPSLMTTVLDVPFDAAGGLGIAILFVAVSGGGLQAARMSANGAMRYGAILLASGAVGLATSLLLGSLPALAVSAVIAGLGVGMTFNGNLRALAAATSAETRSQALTAVYILSYGALSMSALLAGWAAPSLGLRTTSLIYALAVGGLSLAAVMHDLQQHRRA